MSDEAAGSPAAPEFTPPDPPGEGYVWVEAPQDWWRVIAPGGIPRPCRRQGRQHLVCGRGSVAETRRTRYNYRTGRHTADWWAYCEEHIRDYGFHLVDGKLMTWVKEVLA